MRPGSGHLQGALSHGLAAHISEIGKFGCYALCRRRGGYGWCQHVGLVQELHHFRQVAQTVDTDSLGYGCFGGVFDRNQEIANAATSGADCDGKRSTDWAQAAIQGKFAHDHIVVSVADGTHCTQNGCGHRQVKARAFFADVRRREIDRHRFAGVAEAGVEQGRLDTFAALLDSGVGHSDCDKVAIVTAGVHVDLNVDKACVNALNNRAVGAKQCHGTLVWETRIFLRKISFTDASDYYSDMSATFLVQSGIWLILNNLSKKNAKPARFDGYLDRPASVSWPYTEIIAMQITDRTKVRRLPARGSNEWKDICDIFDAGFLAHVGFALDGQPFVIPTLYGRQEETLYLHGSAASRMLRQLEQGIAACVTITLVDGLVLARSAFHHSMNYRSVVAFGTARKIQDDPAKEEALRVISEQVLAGRWNDVRLPTAKELKATTVLAFEIAEASAKVRTGPPKDDAEDYTLPIWAGVVPLALKREEAIPDPLLTVDAPMPDYVR